MKLRITLLLSLGICSSVMAQKNNVGIGTAEPDASAALEIKAENKGLLMPRMSLQQRNAIQNPAKGLIVYQTDMLSGFYYFDGKEWKPMNQNTSVNAVADASNWGLTGNVALSTNFLGTTNDQPLRIKIRGSNAGLIGSSVISAGVTFLGFKSGDVNTGADNAGFGYQTMTFNTTGRRNVAIGPAAMYRNTTGSFNVAVGASALFANTTGSYNLVFGNAALSAASAANGNVAVGSNSMLYKLSGDNNTGVGANTLYRNASGASNVALGTNAGYNALGNGNIFIGFEAGYSETGANRLYIANSNTTTPLIRGEFDNQVVKFHTGTASPTGTTGFLAIGDFATPIGTNAGSGGITSFPRFTTSSKYRLIVQDGILTEKVKVALRNGTDWADYVFEPTYERMSLEKVEAYVKANKHLPNVPSADEMVKDGLDVSQTSKMFMEKIEELTLYMIELNKELKALKAENEALKQSLKK